MTTDTAAPSAVTLADVDGTTGPAVAVLVLVDLSDDDRPPMRERYAEPRFADPDLIARQMLASTVCDFPGFTATVILNERARYLRWRRSMASLGYTSDEGRAPEDYLETVYATADDAAGR